MSARAFCLLLASAALAPNFLAAQSNNSSVQDLPLTRGVYYRTASGWVPLPTTVLVPHRSAGLQQLLGLAREHAVAELPGPRSPIWITDGRPVLYLRGFSGVNGLYLAREVSRPDHRELRMHLSGHFADGPQLRREDLHLVDVQAAGDGVESLKPRVELAPGEYVLVSAPERPNRWIRFGFDFGVAPVAAK